MLVAGVAVSGCGSSSQYANDPRPPAPINVTAAISDQRITVSPRTFGAGQIVLIIANQSATSQKVTLQTNEVGSGKPGIRQTTSPVNPRGTAELKVDVSKGTYEVSVASDRVRPASITVGAKRASAQDDLLQP
jgi:hypothetical protein